MSTFRIITEIMRADFLERVRRASFLVTMLAAVYLGYAVNAGYVVIKLGSYRGIYNSAWVGTLVAESASMFIALVGFYVVKNAVSRDRQTRVGEILSATPVSSFLYLLGKALSNFGVLAAVVAIQAVSAVVMQLLGRENPSLDLIRLLLPFFFITLPSIAFVASAAVLFEALRLLRGGFGNVIYFFLIQAFLILAFEGHLPAFDVLYLGPIETSMQSAATAAYPGYKGEFTFNAGPRESTDTVRPFVWDGIRWTPAHAGERLAWYGYSLLFVLLATLFFDRFDETIRRRRSLKAPPEATAARGKNRARPVADRIPTWPTWWAVRSRFAQLVIAELRLMLKGVHWAWYLVSAGLLIASLASPAEVVKAYLLPVSWIWPVLLWSKMGMREAAFGTGQLIFSSPHVRTIQYFALWTAGFLIAIVTGAGAAVTLLADGGWQSLSGILAGALFIPSLALALGVWSTGSRLFEAFYSIWWYIGPLNRVPGLDFTGTSSPDGTFSIYFLLAGACLGIGFIGRQRQPAV